MSQHKQLLSYATKEKIDDFFKGGDDTSPNIMDLTKVALLNMFHPVGSIYMTMSRENPHEHLGGEWRRIAEGRTLFGVDSVDVDFAEDINDKDDKGNKASVVRKHSHDIPEHRHSIAEHTHIFRGSSVNSGIQSASHVHRITDHRHWATGTSTNNTRPESQFFMEVTTSAVVNDIANTTGNSRRNTPTIAPSHNFVALDRTGGITTNPLSTQPQSASHHHSVTAQGTNSSSALTTNPNSAALETGPYGESLTNDNLPPYITCYMWERIH